MPQVIFSLSGINYARGLNESKISIHLLAKQKLGENVDGVEILMSFKTI
jgi:hypothetical protein